MKLEELNRDQLIELKQDALCKILEALEDRCPSWGELAGVDEIVSDELLVSLGYDSYVFSNDDFFCTCEL